LFQVSVAGLPTAHPVGKPITFTVDASQAGEGNSLILKIFPKVSIQ
jgi:hypothetical protein